jgi:hypothetical protein
MLARLKICRVHEYDRYGDVVDGLAGLAGDGVLVSAGGLGGHGGGRHRRGSRDSIGGLEGGVCDRRLGLGPPGGVGGVKGKGVARICGVTAVWLDAPVSTRSGLNL